MANTEALPGNPYARDLHNRARDAPLSEEALASLAVAHELRTLALVEHAGSENMGAIAARREVRERLGL